jgi:hypothetical protein
MTPTDFARKVYKTHPEITNPLYRQTLAREILVIRKVARELKDSPREYWVINYINGAETILRRLCNTEYVKEITIETKDKPRELQVITT